MTAVRSVGAETLNLHPLSMNGFERKTHSNKLDNAQSKISELVLHTYLHAVNRSQSSFSGMHTGLEPE